MRILCHCDALGQPRSRNLGNYHICPEDIKIIVLKAITRLMTTVGLGCDLYRERMTH